MFFTNLSADIERLRGKALRDREKKGGGDNRQSIERARPDSSRPDPESDSQKLDSWRLFTRKLEVV